MIILFDFDAREVDIQAIYPSCDTCCNQLNLPFTVVEFPNSANLLKKSAAKYCFRFESGASFSRSSFAFGNCDTGISFIPQIGQVPGFVKRICGCIEHVHISPSAAACFAFAEKCTHETNAAKNASTPSIVPILRMSWFLLMRKLLALLLRDFL